MSIAYVVRCNFQDAEHEARWNDWYSGPKLRNMLEKPLFLTGQRFRLIAGNGRDYLAYWTLQSAAALETPEYRSDWGFYEWRPYIGAWNRDLFAAERGEVSAPVVGPDEVLRLVSFEGLDEAAASRARREIDAARPGTTWLRADGIDRATPFLGVSVERDATPGRVPDGTVEGFYRPISDLARTVAPAAS